ncbi:MAG: hypothetical protein HXY23_03350 [Parvularculaceae bacterium]|nr:hypothetical protein [Parvularculaceae bacterium]
MTSFHSGGAGAAAPLAVLGPTNTGKTHYAIERMLGHDSGMIGLPLRLLAREVYDRIVAVRGKNVAALYTGEEKIIPPHPRYWICTVEAMPVERQVSFLAVDEIQLAADPERGRVFTSRLLHARGTGETLFLGSQTMRPILRGLFPDVKFLARDRLSVLKYAGSKKVSRLPRRSAIVGFSAESVYAIAELIRRQRGGAAVVLGALSPRTRNAQAALYQSGEVDYLVATDAIGMGLNMDIDHVAFSSRRKFDGRGFRDLRPDELAQIAGRAGRYMRDGSFGVTADCPPFDEEIIEAIEDHVFEPAKALQWRSEDLNFHSIPHLIGSLQAPPPRPQLQLARTDDDELALAALAADEEIARLGVRGDALRLLWETCQIPDFRKSSLDHHARLIGEIFLQLANSGRIPTAWIAPRIAGLENVEGDIDLLSKRIAHVRTWTYLSHRAAWIEDAAYWQEKARSIEDGLSDALHEKLTQRFVDRRTSVLLKKLKDDAPVLAGVTEDGDVIVEGQFVGRLLGFEFIVDPRAKGLDAKRIRGAADKALAPVLAARAAALATAASEDLQLKDDGVITWRSSPVARLEKGPAPLRPNIVVRGLDALSPHLRGRIYDRLKDFFAAKVEALLGELIALGQAAAASEGDVALGGQARGVAFRLVENFGAMSRSQFGEELKQLGQEERAKLRNLGVRFGEYTLFMPKLLKPQPAKLLTLLWALWTDRQPGAFTPPKAGLVSFLADEAIPHAYYYACGYRPSGARAVRIDMLERLAGQIRSERREGEYQGGFEASQQMMSLVGCSGEEFEGILTSLGYRKQTIKVKKPAKPVVSVAATAAAEVIAEAPAEITLPPETEAEADMPAPVEAVAPIPQSAAPPEAATLAADASATAETAPSATPAEAGAPSAETEMIDVVIWKMAPRRQPYRKPRETRGGERRDGRREARGDGERPERGPRNDKGGDRRSDRRPDRQDDQRRGGDGPRGDRGPRRDRERDRDRGPRPDGPRGDRAPRRQESPLMTMPQHRKVADPSSPFAVLAGLKDQLAGKPDPAKEPETSS